MTDDFSLSIPDWNIAPQLSVSGALEQSSSRCVIIPTTQGSLTISLHQFGARLHFGDCSFGGGIENSYGMLLEDAFVQAPPFDLFVDGSQAAVSKISGGKFTLTINHSPLSFELMKGEHLVQKSATDGHFVRQFRLPPVARMDKGWLVTLDLNASESVYGLGEKWGKLDKRGQLIRSFNHDALGVNAEMSYKNAPFAWSNSGWGAFVHTAAPVLHSVGYAPWSQRAYGILVEDSALDLFLLAGNDGGDIIGHYTALTGRAPVPPLWSAGVILSKAYYQDADELLATARDVRAHKMPCDVITIDGRAWQDTETRFTFDWDPKRYTDPGAVIDELKALNFKVCLWEYPLVSVKHTLFSMMEKKGWLLKDRKTGEVYRYHWDTSCFGDVLTELPESGIVDFTHPEAYKFWRDSHKSLFDLGVDMIKADFGEQIEPDMVAYNGDTGDVLHNVYSLLYNRCVYEAAEMYCQSGAFLFSRSSWIGSQRYPSQWGGDPQADWGGLAGSIRGGLSWGMTGAPYYATDVGGFYGDQRDAELYVRWIQFAIFSAHIRLHGIGQREPWSYEGEPHGKEANAAATQALQLRYRLLPYIQKTMQTASDSGLPVQRAMALAFPKDRAAWAFEEQFMFGDDLLVAPCLQAGGCTELYLPAGRWQRLLHDEVFEGGRCYQLQLPLDEMAVFFPEGVVIPLGPVVESTCEI